MIDRYNKLYRWLIACLWLFQQSLPWIYRTVCLALFYFKLIQQKNIKIILVKKMSLLHVPKLNAFYKVIHTPYRNHHQCPRMGTKKVGKRMSYLEENPEYYKARCCYSKSYFKYQKKSFEKRHHKNVIQNPHYRWAEFRRRLINGHFYL